MNLRAARLIESPPDMTIEEALAIAQKHRIGTLPMVKEGGELVGISTTTDLATLMSQVLGFNKAGVRYLIYDCPAGEKLRSAISIIHAHRGDIQTLFTFCPPNDPNRVHAVVRTGPDDPTKIVKDLSKLGFNVEIT